MQEGLLEKSEEVAARVELMRFWFRMTGKKIKETGDVIRVLRLFEDVPTNILSQAVDVYLREFDFFSIKKLFDVLDDGVFQKESEKEPPLMGVEDRVRRFEKQDREEMGMSEQEYIEFKKSQPEYHCAGCTKDEIEQYGLR